MNLNDLNREQRVAAETLEGPLLVLAGAGSGKTKMLTYRIANLIEHGVAPYHIMAITFTNKAAGEMRSRVAQLVGEGGEQVWVSTFHAACARILRRDIEKIGYKRNFVIYDDSDQDTLLKGIIKQLDLDSDEYPVRKMKTIISHAKEKIQSPEDWYRENNYDYRAMYMKEIYARYEARLKESNALDFNDLIIKTLELLVNHPPVLQYYHHTLRYFHVDEYQDTDFAQYQLIHLLAQEERNLCVVGDDDQSIYSWRGADIENIHNFQRDFPEAKIIKLERNYRSSANILDAANQVIACNRNRMDKALWTEREPGEKITLFNAENEKIEARWVASTIQRLLATGRSYSDFTILYRTNAQSRNFEEAFNAQAIPYRLYGSLKFYDRKEIKDANAYLRLLLNPTDDVSLQRIINVPKRGIGEASVASLMEYAASSGIPAMSACMCLPDDFSKRARTKIEAFSQLILKLTYEMEKREMDDFIKYMIEETGLKKEYLDDQTEEGRVKALNLDELVNAVTEFHMNYPDKTLLDFLETTSLESSFDAIDENAGFVTLMTMHGAKGLEFPVVFMVGMDQGIFPSFRSFEYENAMEEERRLCYVGITRAKDKLYMSHAKSRYKNGEDATYTPSQFLEDIPPRLLEETFPYADRSMQSGKSNTYNRRNLEEELSFDNGNQWRTTRSQGSMGRAPGFGSGNSVRVGGQTIPGVQRGFGSTAGSGRNTQGPQNMAGQKRVVSQAATVSCGPAYQAGDRVMHRTFGMGQILEIRPGSNGNRLVIRFSSGAVKEFEERLAPIVRMEG